MKKIMAAGALLRQNTGSMFILSLWALVFLSLLAFLSGAMVRQHIIAVQKLEERAYLYDIAEAGIFTAIEAMSSFQETDTSPSTDSLNDFWADDRGLFKERRFAAGDFSVYYGFDKDGTGKQERKYGVIDENRKININYAPEEVLAGLFSAVGGLDNESARALAFSVMDWRDEDDLKAGIEEELSETFDYRSGGYGYVPKNKMFSTVEELLLVKGIDIGIFARVRDSITVFSDGKININTAPQEVFVSMGFDDALAQKVIFLRAGENRVAGDFDDRVFNSPAALYNDLISYYDLSEKERAMIAQVLAYDIIDVASGTFRAQSISKLDTGSMYGKITCVFDKGGTIHYWSARYLQEDSERQQ